MNVIEIRAIEGPNMYTHKPVIMMKLSLGEYWETTTKDIPGFVDGLLEGMPSLHEHFCSRGHKGGFVERLYEGTYLGHVVEHVALELQSLAGFKVIYGKTVRAETEDSYFVVTEFESKEGAIQALKSSVENIVSLLKGQATDFSAAVLKIKQIGWKYGLGPSTAAIGQEALKRGIPIMRLGEGSILQLGYGKYQRKVEATITDRTPCIGVDVACDKVLVKQMLADLGIPVPWGGVARTESEALELANQIGEAVVVKPYDGNQGKGVALDLKNDAEIKKALEMVLHYSPKAVVEKYIEGRHIRLAVVDYKVVAAAERIPAFVVGDGHSTIKELIEMVNLDPLRGDGHEKPLTKIVIDSVVLMVLARKGLSLDSVPGEEEIVYLRDNANLSTGGVAIDVTGQINPITLQVAQRAVRLIGLDVAGVDVVIKDLSKPLDKDNGAIIEINAAPGIRMHHFPTAGNPRNVAGAIVEMLFPKGSTSRVPIISITGTNGKTTVTRLIGHVISSLGHVVGMTNSDGIYVNGSKIVSGDTTGSQSAKVVLRDPTVEYAVLETARGGILRSGLGYDYSDVAVVTNISNDHLGLQGIDTFEDLTYLKSVVVEAVHKGGKVVLNADDSYVASMAERAKAEVVYFSSSFDNIIVKRHLGCGGTAVFLKNGSVTVARGNNTQRVIGVKTVPCTLNGKLQHNVQNVLAAVAGCISLGFNAAQIREALYSFEANEKTNPGRFNIFDVNNFRVIIDYGHNEAGYLNTFQAIKKLKPHKVIGVLGMPGDRGDADIVSAAKIAAKYCHHFLLKDDLDTRGRRNGEVPELMKSALIGEGIKEKQIEVILPEDLALQKAMEIATENDIVIVFYEKYNKVHKIVMDYIKNNANMEETLEEIKVMAN